MQKYTRRHFLQGGLSCYGVTALPVSVLAKGLKPLPPISDFYKNLTGLAVSAHRGAFENAPENSLLAIKNAIDLGVEMTEVDVRMTADGVPVLFHDFETNRMLGVDTFISLMTYAQLQNYTLRNTLGGLAVDITDQKVPTLEQTIDMARDKIYLHLDIKDKKVTSILPDIIRNMNAGHMIKMYGEVKTVQHIDTIKQAQEYYGGFIVPSMRFSADNIQDMLAILDILKPLVVYAKFDSVTTLQQVSQYAKHHNIKIEGSTLKFSYSIVGYYDTDTADNPHKIWGTLHNSGMDIIMTDRIQHITAWRKTL